MIGFLASISWTRVGGTLVLFAILATGLWQVRLAGITQGRLEVRSEWDADIADRSMQAVADEKEARRKEQDMQDAANELQAIKDAQITTLTSDLAAARASNRVRHPTSRPANFTPPTAPPATAAESCSGATLFAEDAEFLVGEAARADVLRLDVQRCEALYTEVNTLLRELLGVPAE
jgi:hypothetical protein